MPDDNWIRALKKHNRERPPWDLSTSIVGGGRELAQQSLGPRAKEDPERFARLALRFTSDTPADAMNEILHNSEGALDVDLLTELCEHADHTYGSEVGRWVCSAIRRSDKFNRRLVALIYACSRDPDPESNSARITTSDGRDLLLEGLNSTRGEAALAVGKVLFTGSDHLNALLPIVESLALGGC